MPCVCTRDFWIHALQIAKRPFMLYADKRLYPETLSSQQEAYPSWDYSDYTEYLRTSYPFLGLRPLFTVFSFSLSVSLSVLCANAKY